MLKQLYLGLFLTEGETDCNLFFSIFLFILGFAGLGGILYNIEGFDLIGFMIGSMACFGFIAVAIAIIENEIKLVYKD